MTIKFTDEALELWNKLSEEDRIAWTSKVTCQKCQAEIKKDDFSGSIYEGSLALFHLCKQCSNKEVRLIDVDETSQQEIDDDFDQWIKSKQEKQPGAFKK